MTKKKKKTQPKVSTLDSRTAQQQQQRSFFNFYFAMVPV
jgi:hypothetical protein